LTTCRKNGITKRHNALRDAWAQVLTSAGIQHAKEVIVPCGDRPANILKISWDSPLALHAFPLNTEKARRHLNNAEKDKRTKHLHHREKMGWGHHPAAYSPWGGQGSAAKGFLFEVLKRATTDQQCWPKTQHILELRQNLSITLVREVAGQLSLVLDGLDSQ